MQTRVRDRIVFGAIVAALALVVGTMAAAQVRSAPRPTLAAAPVAVPEPAQPPATAAAVIETPVAATPEPATASVPQAVPEPALPANVPGGAVGEVPAIDRERTLVVEAEVAPTDTRVVEDTDEVAITSPSVDDESSTESAGTVEIEHHLAEIPESPQVGETGTERSFEVERPRESDDPWASVRRCESHNNYSINTGNGFYGAYQFTISTWNWVAELIGRTDLIGVRPDLATPADQDRLAEALAFEVPGGGLGHWPVCGRYYGR